MVIIKQKLVIDTQMIKIKEWKDITIKKNHQITRKNSRRGRKKLQNNQKSKNKMVIVSFGLSITTLNIKENF